MPARAARRAILAGALLVVAAGCRSLDGDYRPDCVAFAGDEVTIAGETFTWDKFTDALRVDDEGNVIDPYPAYPKEGRLVTDGDLLRFLDAAGSEIAVRHAVPREDALVLLDAEEYEAFRETGAWPDCPLSRVAD